MDEITAVNSVTLRGTPAGEPYFSHESRGEIFYEMPLSVRRLSGVPDIVNIILRKGLLINFDAASGQQLQVRGELRSFNSKAETGPRLVITVFARDIFPDSGEDENCVLLAGTICKQPNLRTTPMGREICDLMLAVNRHYGRSDYLPCIAWGMKAREASHWPVGTFLKLTGRMQSRTYTKQMEGRSVEKTAFEVSVLELFRTEKINLPQAFSPTEY